MMLLWLALAMVLPLVFTLIEIPGFMPFRLFYALIAAVVALNDVALWFLLIALLNLNDRAGLVRSTNICAIALVSFACWTPVFSFSTGAGDRAPLLLADVGITIPAILLELWGLVLVLSALRKRLDERDGCSPSLPCWPILFRRCRTWVVWEFAGRIGLLHRSWRSRCSRLPGVAWTPTPSSTPCCWRPLFTRPGATPSSRANGRTRSNRSTRAPRNCSKCSSPNLSHRFLDTWSPAHTVPRRRWAETSSSSWRCLTGALLVIGDVSGKGLHAAMTVALIVGSIRSTVETTDDPAAMLAALNRRLHGRLRSGFATCLVLRLDAEGRCLVANAGHLPPFLNGEEVPLPPALPLGLVPDAEYEPTEVGMGSGDRLTLYTDGLLEARNVAGELFGFRRIAEFLATPRDAKEIAEAAQQFGQDDDITVLTLTFAGVGVVHA